MIESLIKQIELALNLEQDKSFTNFQGKKKSFAEFMQEALPVLLSAVQPLYQANNLLLEKNKLNNCIELYKYYESSELTQRIHIVKNTRHEVQEIYKTIKQITNAPQITKVEKNINKNLDKDLWDIECKWIPGIGPRNANTLAKLELLTVYDLLLHLPRRHLDFSNMSRIESLEAGSNVTILAQVKKLHIIKSLRNPQLNIVNLTLHDGTGSILLTKFLAGKSGKFLAQQFRQQYPEGVIVLAYGQAKYGKKTRFELTNYSLEIIDSDNNNSGAKLQDYTRIIPVYPLAEGMRQEYFRKIIHNTIEQYSKKIEETLPKWVFAEQELMDLGNALTEIHQPSSVDKLEAANTRLAFEEFLFLQMPFARKDYSQKMEALNKFQRQKEIIRPNLIEGFLALLPFELTGAQRRVFNEILADLNGPYPLSRLVQGDVGSGKTVIAMLAMLVAIERGGQAAMMAPTEILAEQHYKKCQSLFTELGLKVALLTGSLKTAARREILEGLHSGQIHIVIGTHALIQEGVEFNDLRLAVIDEQHRFGVNQREVLRNKGAMDCLFMTATPIPRTLALSLYGNLSLSEIDEMPPGRKPISTHVLMPKERKSMHAFIKKELKKGSQAYIVYPLIEESETLSAQAALDEYEKLLKIYPEYKLAVLHGKLMSYEKEQIMNSFQKGEIHVLVATTVIEVGVDVSNATVMVIENAERFGLAQLHQLRGRVGRGGEQSYCFLVSSNNTERLQIMEETENGFLIAQKDLEIRGPGELIGTRQSGISDFALARLLSHGHLLEPAKAIAQKLIEKDPELKEQSKAFLYRYNALLENINIS